MIITRTPLRVSLVGGGTDLPAFFANQFGAVVSFAIDKYIYISVNPKFDGRTRLSYNKIEDVDSDDLQYLSHDIARETLRFFDVRGVEISSVSDIPGSGSGLGASSAYAVGLGLALRAYKGWAVNQHPAQYAIQGYQVEREWCGHPVGKQDHYAAAYGGLHYYQFNQDDVTTAELLPLDEEKRHWLEETLMLFYTGRSRSADIVLKDQEANLARMEGAWQAGVRLRDAAVGLRNQLRLGNIDSIAVSLLENWENKKRLSGGVSMGFIDDIYDKAMANGALGGKICGAGGGGFMLFAVEQGRQMDVERALELPRLKFRIEDRGSCILYNSEVTP